MRPAGGNQCSTSFRLVGAVLTSVPSLQHFPLAPFTLGRTPFWTAALPGFLRRQAVGGSFGRFDGGLPFQFGNQDALSVLIAVEATVLTVAIFEHFDSDALTKPLALHTPPARGICATSDDAAKLSQGVPDDPLHRHRLPILVELPATPIGPVDRHTAARKAAAGLALQVAGCHG